MDNPTKKQEFNDADSMKRAISTASEDTVNDTVAQNDPLSRTCDTVNCLAHMLS